MTSLLTKDGSLVLADDGSLVLTNDPANCECCRIPAQFCCNGVFGWSEIPPDGLPSTSLTAFASIGSTIESFVGTVFEGGNRSSLSVLRNIPLEFLSDGCTVSAAGSIHELVASGVTAPMTGNNDRYDIYVRMGVGMGVSINPPDVGFSLVDCAWAVGWGYGLQGAGLPVNDVFGLPLMQGAFPNRAGVYSSTRGRVDDQTVIWDRPLPYAFTPDTIVTGTRTFSIRRSLGIPIGADVVWEGLRYTNAGVVGGGQNEVNRATMGFQIDGTRRCAPSLMDPSAMALLRQQTGGCPGCGEGNQF